MFFLDTNFVKKCVCVFLAKIYVSKNVTFLKSQKSPSVGPGSRGPAEKTSVFEHFFVFFSILGLFFFIGPPEALFFFHIFWSYFFSCLAAIFFFASKKLLRKPMT